MAGGVAAIATTPLDVCKTLLNTNERCAGAVAAGEPTMRGGRIIFAVFYAARTIYHQAGWRGFLRGWQARTLFTVPSGAISWTVYEAFKHYLVPHLELEGDEDDLEPSAAAMHPSRSSGQTNSFSSTGTSDRSTSNSISSSSNGSSSGRLTGALPAGATVAVAPSTAEASTPQ